MERFEPDVEHVARALLEGPYPQLGGVALTKVISFGAAEAEQAQTVVLALKQETLPVAPIRPMVAGARVAFERSPSRYISLNAEQLVLRAVSAGQTAAIRRPGPWRTRRRQARTKGGRPTPTTP